MEGSVFEGKNHTTTKVV